MTIYNKAPKVLLKPLSQAEVQRWNYYVKPENVFAESMFVWKEDKERNMKQNRRKEKVETMKDGQTFLFLQRKKKREKGWNEDRMKEKARIENKERKRMNKGRNKRKRKVIFGLQDIHEKN